MEATREDSDTEDGMQEPLEFDDPSVDEENEKWANSQRQGRKSDAVLSCPACFTTLCMDCQRHEIYVTQYRAMFVTENCIVCHDEVHDPLPAKGRRSNKRKRVLPVESTQVLRPVRCANCNVQVGVYDTDEVFYFFNTLASHS